RFVLGLLEVLGRNWPFDRECAIAEACRAEVNNSAPTSTQISPASCFYAYRLRLAYRRKIGTSVHHVFRASDTTKVMGAPNPNEHSYVQVHEEGGKSIGKTLSRHGLP